MIVYIIFDLPFDLVPEYVVGTGGAGAYGGASDFPQNITRSHVSEKEDGFLHIDVTSGHPAIKSQVSDVDTFDIDRH